MVYERLRRLVVDGQVPAGVRISESELAATLTVSRTPVREALSRLAGDGLVQAQGRGVRVLVLDGAELDQVLEARAEFEACTARRLAERVRAGLVAPAVLRELDELAAETDRLTRAGELSRAVLANRDVHLRIARLAGNPVIVRSLELWWDQVVLATRHGLHEPARADDVAAEHERILATIRAGEPARAAKAAHRHVTRTRTHLATHTPPDPPRQ